MTSNFESLKVVFKISDRIQHLHSHLSQSFSTLFLLLPIHYLSLGKGIHLKLIKFQLISLTVYFVFLLFFLKLTIISDFSFYSTLI